MSSKLHVCEMFSSIQGEGLLAGRRQIFIRLADCNLDCRYCDTDFVRKESCSMEQQPGSNQFKPVPLPLSPAAIVGVIEEWTSQLPGAHHSISLTGGEPLLSVDVLNELLPQMRRLLPLHLETNGTMYLALQQVLAHVDYISMDMKLPSTSGCSDDLWELHRFFLQTARTGSGQVSVKIVVGEQSGLDEIEQVCAIIAAIDPGVPLFIQPLTLPGGRVGISAVHLLRLQAVAAARLADVRVTPQMHAMLGVL